MKELELNKFLDYRYLSNIAYSPDGEKEAFIVSDAVVEENRYDHNIYIKQGTKIQPLTNSGKDSNFIWEDNDTLLFSSVRLEEDKKRLESLEELSVFYRISTTGGEAQVAFRIPLTVTKIQQVKKGTYILGVSYDLNTSHMHTLSREGRTKLLEEKKENQDYEVMDEIPFYLNGAGYSNKKRTHLYLYEEGTDTLTSLVGGYFDVGYFELNQDKTKLLIVGNEYQDKSLRTDGIYTLDLSSKKLETVLQGDLYSVHLAVYFGDGILFAGSDMKDHGINENPNFYQLNMRTKEVALFKEYDLSIGSSVGSDARLLGGKSFCVEDQVFYFSTTVRNASHIKALHFDGSITDLVTKEGSVDCFTVHQGNIALIGLYENQLQEIYETTVGEKVLKKVSSFNEEVLKDTYIADYNKITFLRDGIELDGWVLEPKDYDPNKKYPAILDIHGGPKTVYGEVFYHEMQVWANQGYFVFFMNPRGSDGRGNEFLDIFGKYGTIDYEDIMTFTDRVLEKYPQIDEARVGVTGGSYGGFMTNWIIGHTKRFKCAATQRSISNWISFTNTSDIGTYFGPDQIQGDVWESPEKLWWHSPIKYADQVKTPTLFIHSNEDYRCPLEQGIQLFTALRNFGVESKFVMFKGENHELSRSGKPRHRIRRLTEITKWMDQYLK